MLIIQRIHDPRTKGESMSAKRTNEPRSLPPYVLDEKDKVHCRDTRRREACGKVLRGIWWSGDWVPDNYPHCLTCLSMTRRIVYRISDGLVGTRPRRISGGAFGQGRRS